MIQNLIKWVMSPLAFAIGFLMPLFAQIIVRAEIPTAGLSPWIFAAVLAMGFGIMAQTRGSWIWIKP